MTERLQMHWRIHRYILFICAFLIAHTSSVIAQVTLTPARLDFGSTSSETIWVRDIVVKNEGNKTDFLLRHTFSHEYSVLLSTKSMAPDSTMVIRVQFKPREKTIYNEKIQLYFASLSEPVVITVHADVKYLNPEDHLPCPDFSRQSPECCPKFMFLAEVYDITTGAPIGQAKMQFQPMDGESLRMQTNAQGKLTYDMPIQYYYIKTTAEGYKSDIRETYINHRKNQLRIGLTPIAKPSPPIPAPELEIPSDTAAVDLAVKADSTLLPASCLPNNIVFLLDVSSSMSKDEKLELMKASIVELSKVLRPQDQITLMVYADRTEILLATTTGDQKSLVIQTVSQLKASGKTNGADGFKAAYKVLNENKIKNGNNQLYVITDGAFATTDQALILKSVKRSKRKGIHTSIIGIRANIFAQQNLGSVATLGGGEMIAVDEATDTQRIIADLKAHSLIQ
jgi:Ca-activated chloride channel homolog